MDNTPLLPNLIQRSIYFQRYDRYQSNELIYSFKKKINFPVWGKDTSPTIHSTLTQLYSTFMGFSIAKIPVHYQFIFRVSAHSIYKCQKTTQASFSKQSGFIHFYKWKEEERDLASGPTDGINWEPTCLPPATLLLSVSFSTYHLRSSAFFCAGFVFRWSLLLKNNENLALYLAIQMVVSMFLTNHYSGERWLRLIMKNRAFFTEQGTMNPQWDTKEEEKHNPWVLLHLKWLINHQGFPWIVKNCHIILWEGFKYIKTYS